jgi:hypothetical protein
MLSGFFEQKKLMKVLQDYLYTKYQFATLKPRVTQNKRYKAEKMNKETKAKLEQQKKDRDVRMLMRAKQR